MRNRAKCKLCESIIESFTIYDFVDCKCGQISVHGGQQKFGCSAHDFKNFIRVDDQENEIVVTLKDSEEITHAPEKISLKERLGVLEEMIQTIESLPPQAMQTSISHYDLLSALIVISSILNEMASAKT